MDKFQESEWSQAITDELPPPTELTNAIGTNLEEMNEDCLLDIFSAKSLNVKDLFSLARTCTRFRPIVQRVAPKTLCIVAKCPSDFKIDFGNSCTATETYVESIFGIFGSSLSEVKIEGHSRSEDNFLVQLITKHCNENNLKRLGMQQIQIADVFAVKLKPIFKQLQTLDLNCVSIMDDAGLFSEMDSLVSLCVASVINCDAILKNTFPKLEGLIYSKSDSISHPEEQTFENLSTFISRHTGLKHLNLHASRCNDSRTAILQAIGNNCRELLTLYLMLGWNVDASHLQPIVAIKSLKMLQLWSFSFEDFRLFSPLTELNRLALYQCNLPKIAESFPSLIQLKTLRLCGCSWTDLVGIIRRLSNLEVLALTTPLLEAQGVLSRIVSTIRGRPNVLTVRCSSYYSTTNYADVRNFRLEGKWHQLRL